VDDGERDGYQKELHMLEDIRLLKHQLGAIDEQLSTAVLAAHAAGVSWERIASRLGVTRQAAYSHYSRIEGKRKSDEFNRRHGR
jgi:DNA-directed RNA polymerase specialized sigma24 family protein